MLGLQVGPRTPELNVYCLAPLTASSAQNHRTCPHAGKSRYRAPHQCEYFSSSWNILKHIQVVPDTPYLLYGRGAYVRASQVRRDPQLALLDQVFQTSFVPFIHLIPFQGLWVRGL